MKAEEIKFYTQLFEPVSEVYLYRETIDEISLAVDKHLEKPGISGGISFEGNYFAFPLGTYFLGYTTDTHKMMACVKKRNQSYVAEQRAKLLFETFILIYEASSNTEASSSFKTELYNNLFLLYTHTFNQKKAKCFFKEFHLKNAFLNCVLEEEKSPSLTTFKNNYVGVNNPYLEHSLRHYLKNNPQEAEHAVQTFNNFQAELITQFKSETRVKTLTLMHPNTFIMLGILCLAIFFTTPLIGTTTFTLTEILLALALTLSHFLQERGERMLKPQAIEKYAGNLKKSKNSLEKICKSQHEFNCVKQAANSDNMEPKAQLKRAEYYLRLKARKINTSHKFQMQDYFTSEKTVKKIDSPDYFDTLPRFYPCYFDDKPKKLKQKTIKKHNKENASSKREKIILANQKRTEKQADLSKKTTWLLRPEHYQVGCLSVSEQTGYKAFFDFSEYTVEFRNLVGEEYTGQSENFIIAPKEKFGGLKQVGNQFSYKENRNSGERTFFRPVGTIEIENEEGKTQTVTHYQAYTQGQH